MKKIIGVLLSTVVIITILYYLFIYFVTYSTGVRSGELIKISRKGVIVKTWEGEISQGISGAQIFTFSVEDKNEQVIENLQKYQGSYVKLTYKERYKTFFWLGDTKYFITKVTQENSPHFRSKNEKND
ncbi:6-phosphogluconate dehydrogenase [Polaribacter vadi]|uniref:6-phosphogluconate dehydrogenase n=1 Tax=Polaribacter vadi TaxID=1774273 RepID=A0A1B8TWR5_9FLAO|nr:6-phosphogluconate dehydrogenase [Polaribacter vadi]AOW17002.1 6-phosphogluconate dehydrogenase [Polaribacter vadi]OBY64087.1 6-phosphogluconate dehydrogenase [Polaribacter vadi]